MKHKNVTVNSIFGIPVWQTDPYPFSKKEIRFLKSLYSKVTENKGKNHTSTDRYIFKHKELKGVKKFVQDNLDAYWHGMLAVSKESPLHITQSWVNFNEKTTEHHSHRHTNSCLSGVMYVENTSPILFEKEKEHLILPFLSLKYTALNQLNSPDLAVETKNGALLIFPSSTMHRVAPNQSENCRISISFNTWLSGNVGQDVRLTELIVDEPKNKS
jgi:uncharacterized protein (TIGR02466 family)